MASSSSTSVAQALDWDTPTSDNPSSICTPTLDMLPLPDAKRLHNGPTEAEMHAEQLRPGRRLSSSFLRPQPLPQPLQVASSDPASSTSSVAPEVEKTEHGPKPVEAQGATEAAVSGEREAEPLARPEDRPSDRPVDRNTSAAAPTLAGRVSRRKNVQSQTRAVLEKRLRGSSRIGSCSTPSLTKLASETSSADSVSQQLPSPREVEQMVRTHRRRASESSGYFAAHRIKRLHSDHSTQHHGMPSPSKKRPLSLSDFRLSKVLGNGGSATVVRAEPIPGSGAAAVIPVKEVALKAVPKKGLNKRAQHYLAREIAIHRSVQSHPHVVSLYDVFEDSSGVYLALELLRGSDLYSVLKRERRGFREKVALTIVADVLGALKYMHSMGCAHRDIKPENLMFAERPNFSEGKYPPVKLIDFGLACARDPNAPEKDRTSSEKCGTVRYAAPEIVTETSYVPEQCDIWSVGIVLYSIIAHRNPYTGKSEKEVLHQIQNSPLSFDGPEWDRVTEDTKKLIRWCLSRKASLRPTAILALNEVQRILGALSASDSHSSLLSDEGTWDVRNPRRRGSREPHRTGDWSGFSSSFTGEGHSSNGRRDRSPKEDGESPARSSSDDGTGQPPNFIDGIKAWFSNSTSPDRHGSDSSN